MQVEVIDKGDNVCYVIRSHTKKRTYCGFTNAFWERRIRAHNGEIKGGAKYTRFGRPWSPLFIVKGFRTKKEALHFEYAMKHTNISSYGLNGRIRCLDYVINKKRWTKSCDLAKDIPLTVIWFSSEAHEKAIDVVKKPSYVKFVCDFFRETLNQSTA